MKAEEIRADGKRFGEDFQKGYRGVDANQAIQMAQFATCPMRSTRRRRDSIRRRTSYSMMVAAVIPSILRIHAASLFSSKPRCPWAGNGKGLVPQKRKCEVGQTGTWNGVDV